MFGLFKKKQPTQAGTLSVFVIEGRNLKKGTLGMSRDPYVEVRLVSTAGQFIRMGKSRVVNKTLAPIWNPPQEFMFPIAFPAADTLEVSLYDVVHLGINNELLGKFSIPVSIHLNVQAIDNWYRLPNDNGDLHIVSFYQGEAQMALPAPPPDWLTSYDAKGRLYYTNKINGVTSWVHPSAPPLPCVPIPPPMAQAAPMPYVPVVAGSSAVPPPPAAPYPYSPAVGAPGGVECPPPTAPSAPSPAYVPAAVDPAAAVAAAANATPVAPAVVPSPVAPAEVPQQPQQQQQMYPQLTQQSEDISVFLTNNGMAHLIPVFSKEHIDMMVLRSLTEADMTSLGLAFGDKRKLLILLGKAN